MSGPRTWAVACVALVAGTGGVVGLGLRHAPHAAADGCSLVGHPPGQTILLVDETDELSPNEGAALETIAGSVSSHLAKSARFTIVPITGHAQRPPRSIFSACNPGRSDQIDELTESSTFHRRFEKPLGEVVAALTKPQRDQQSPIMETIANVSRLEGFKDGERELDVYSDLLENEPAPIFNQVHRPGSFTSFERSGAYGRHLATLSGVRVRVFLIDRDRNRALQTDDYLSFWTRYFIRSGAASVAFCAVDSSTPNQREIRCDQASAS